MDDDGVRALHEISLTIRTGERVGVIGWNGAGKTTLLKTMCGIYTPTEGRVRVEGDVEASVAPATTAEPATESAEAPKPESSGTSD